MLIGVLRFAGGFPAGRTAGPARIAGIDRARMDLGATSLPGWSCSSCPTSSSGVKPADWRIWCFCGLLVAIRSAISYFPGTRSERTSGRAAAGCTRLKSRARCPDLRQASSPHILPETVHCPPDATLLGLHSRLWLTPTGGQSKRSQAKERTAESAARLSPAKEPLVDAASPRISPHPHLSGVGHRAWPCAAPCGRSLAVRNPDPEKVSAYECGFNAFDDARMKFDVRFYLVSILFIIFDLEVAFLFPWAVAFGEISMAAFWSMMLFLAVLTVGLCL